MTRLPHPPPATAYEPHSSKLSAILQLPKYAKRCKSEAIDRPGMALWSSTSGQPILTTRDALFSNL